MTLEVLQSEKQIREGRRILERRGLSSMTTSWRRWLQRRRLMQGVEVGDRLKSWDVLKTAQFMEAHVARTAPVLDIGAYASEIPPLLHRMGYRRVCAIDLNPELARMPFPSAIDYRVADFLQAPYQDGSFAAITAISVIEHGFDREALVAEMSRLLAPGGYFIASFDYWPEKIATDGQDVFGMSWTIFSRVEVQELIATAAQAGLKPFGAMNFSCSGEKPISCFSRDYTFAWMVLQRS